MELCFPELMDLAHSNIIHSFNKCFLRAGHVPATVLGTGLSELSMADTAPSPGAPVLAGETHTKLSAPVRVSKNPPAMGAELAREQEQARRDRSF